MSDLKNTNINSNYLLRAIIKEEIKEEINFSILEITSQTITKPLLTHLKLYLNIDISGSMSDHCKDGNTKIEHIKTIIKNLLRELYKFKDQTISIIINGFESTIHKILDIDNLLDQDIEANIIPKIDCLVPLNSTNIELALKTVTEAIVIDTDKTNDTKVVHILLTDGNATEGISNPHILKTFMPKSCKNIILGIGTDYDASALKIISSNKSSIFKHINEAETAGLCVGELIHALLYETLKDVTITISNGEIYDYLSGQWSSTLQVDSIASEQTKTYHIRSENVKDKDKEKVNIRLDWTTNKIAFHHEVSEYTVSDLTKYKYRQDVLELLHIASENSKKMEETDFNNFNNNSNNSNNSNIFNDDNSQDELDELDKLNFGIHEEKYKIYYETKQKKHTESKKEQNNIKQQMKKQMIKIMFYMDENQLQSDVFYIMLCRDLKVAIDSLGKRNAELFITSRMTSQGRQETYTYEPEEETSFDKDAASVEEDSDVEEEEDTNLEESYTRMTWNFKLNTLKNKNKNSKNPNLLLSPYSTAAQVRLMRGISSTPTNTDFDLSDSSEDDNLTIIKP